MPHNGDSQFSANEARNCFALPGWVLCALLLLASFSKAERLPVKTYTVADGLLRDNVTRIHQDSRGFLWFCTVEGISRFDGYGFTNFRTDDGLPDRHTNDFLETRSGIYLIATDAGLARLNPKGLRNSKETPLFTVYLPDNPKAKAISVLFEDASRQVWVGTSDGLYRLKETGDSFVLENVPLGQSAANNLSVTAMIQDRRGGFWIGTDGSGLFRLAPSGEIEQYTTADGLPGNNLTTLLEDAEGRLWAGLRPENTGSLVKLTADPLPGKSIVERVFNQQNGLPANWVSSLYQASDGKMWLGTTRGLCQWQGENASSVCQNYTTQNDLCDLDVWSVIEDKDRNLWTGSVCGVKKLSRYGFTTYTETDGLKNTRILSIFENSAGEFFVSSLFNRQYISKFDGQKFLTVAANLPKGVKNFGWGWKQTVWQEREKGDWWVPTGEGLFRFRKPRAFTDLSGAIPEEMKTGARGKEIFRLFEDSRGDIWITVIGNPSELLRWERAAEIWHDYTETLGFTRRILGGTGFLEDFRGNLWIAIGSDTGESGLIRYRDGQFKVFDKADGAPPGWTRDLFLDHAGRLWIANAMWGLLRLDDTTSEQLNFVRYTTAEGLSSNGVYCVTEDEFGRIYVGTGRGIDRLTPESGQVENFTTANGLPGSDVQIAYRDRNNALWFATTTGLSRFQPEAERTRQPPTVLITGLQVGGIGQPVSILGETEIPQIELSADQKQVSIDFLGLGATLGEKLRYEYRITGEDWTPTNERTLNFANLAAGSYRFEIRAVSADRIYSQPATVSFSIAPPLWQRWWFITLTSFFAVLAIYLIYRNRLSRLLELERMRTRIATDLHDDIGANLTKIAILSEVAQQRFAQKTNGKDELLPSIAELSRESVSSMGDIVWAINPKKDTLDDLTLRMRQYAREVLEQREIRLDFTAPDVAPELRFDANQRRNIYLIFKESLNNIVRHSGAEIVRIDLQISGSKFILTIADDGRGFNTTREYDGNGLLSMKKRASDFGGQLEISSPAGAGTRVVLSFSL